MWHTTWADSNVRSGDEQLTHLQQFPVLRGGAVNTNQIGTRCAFRLVKYSAHGHGDWVGFRCAK
jgi:formylglycine-generating enzyme required for sulfatase activity